MALSKSVNLAHAQRAVPCNVCEDEVPGEYYCIECQQTLCSQCEKNHKRVAATKNHNIILRTQVGDIDRTTLTCADHGDQASCHCEKCNLPVCIKCITGKHKGHAMSDLNDILEKERNLLEDDIKAMQRAIPILKTKRDEMLKEKGNYKKKIQEITKNMGDEKQSAINELERIHKERMNDLTSIQNSHLAVFDGFVDEIETKIISCEDKISEYENMISKKSFLIPRDVAKGKVYLLEIESTPELPCPPSFVSGNIDTLAKNLGKLSFSSESPIAKPYMLSKTTILSKFKSPLNGYPRICIARKGDVWLGGYESRELVMVDIKGQILQRKKTLNRTTSLAVMENGDIIISPRHDDSKSIIRLQKDGKERPIYDTLPSYSYGISVTPDQKILICTVDGRVVRINADGTDVKQIYKGDMSATHAVEKTNGNIYISDRGKSAVVVVGTDGQIQSIIKHTTDGQKLGRPAGLVRDKMDNVLCSDFINGCVYIIDKNQQMWELMGPSDGIRRPGLMAVDNDYNLWITQEDGTVLVVKYFSQ